MSRNWSYVKGAFKNLNAAKTISNIAKKKTYENDEEINNVHQSDEGDDYLKAGDSGDDDDKLYRALSKEVRGGGSSDTIDGTNQTDTRKGTKKNSSCDGNNAIDKKRNRTHKKKRKSDKKSIAADIKDADFIFRALGIDSEHGFCVFHPNIRTIRKVCNQTREQLASVINLGCYRLLTLV